MSGVTIKCQISRKTNSEVPELKTKKEYVQTTMQAQLSVHSPTTSFTRVHAAAVMRFGGKSDSFVYPVTQCVAWHEVCMLSFEQMAL